LSRIEDIANDVVLENGEVTTRLMAVDDARDCGARALFGEKYGDEVRVVSMGNAARDGAASNALGWSVELCGGTHVRRTGDIGMITVTNESAVSSRQTPCQRHHCARQIGRRRAAHHAR
jgi:alanyl-tRNA synthetase